MAPTQPYQPITVASAQELAEKYAKDIVVVASYDSAHHLLHITTYGKTPQDKAWAVMAGERVSSALGVPNVAEKFEDYRLRQAQNLFLALKDLWDQVEQGRLVRDTSRDDGSEWFRDQAALVSALKRASNALEEGEKFLGGLDELRHQDG